VTSTALIVQPRWLASRSRRSTSNAGSTTAHFWLFLQAISSLKLLINPTSVWKISLAT
jgi:hypothetical protein